MSTPTTPQRLYGHSQGVLFGQDLYTLTLTLAIVDGAVVMAQVEARDPRSLDLLAMHSIPSLHGVGQSTVSERVAELLYGCILDAGPFAASECDPGESQCPSFQSSPTPQGSP